MCCNSGQLSHRSWWVSGGSGGTPGEMRGQQLTAPSPQDLAVGLLTVTPCREAGKTGKPEAAGGFPDSPAQSLTILFLSLLGAISALLAAGVGRRVAACPSSSRA